MNRPPLQRVLQEPLEELEPTLRLELWDHVPGAFHRGEREVLYDGRRRATGVGCDISRDLIIDRPGLPFTCRFPALLLSEILRPSFVVEVGDTGV